tara:strand:- start:535 stop:1182 length:648 start_codon:yes stop_codon:yes gene_type:complete
MDSSLKDTPISRLSTINELTSSLKKKSLPNILDNTNKVSDKVNKVIDIANTNPSSGYKMYFIIIIIIIVLSFIGINIFVYLAYGTELIKNVSKPIVEIISSILLSLGIITSDLSLSGAKSLTKTGDKMIRTTSGTASAGIVGTIDQLKQTLNSNKNTDNNEEENNSDTSSLDTNNYCYVGKYKNKRYCTKIDNRNKCISGDLYSSMDMCINPKIR